MTGEVRLETVLVTGAAGALGSALSRLIARAGLNVVMLDHNRRGLEAAYDLIVEAGLTEPALYPMDLAGTGPEHMHDLIEKLEQEFGGLDALVHCAARFEGLRPLEQVSPEEWLVHIQVNLNAAWLLSVHCLPLLRRAAAGRLYFLLDDLERMRRSFWGPYGVSKHGLAALTEQFAAELRSTAIQVLGIDPGPLRSDLRARAFHGEDPKQLPDPARAAGKVVDYLLGNVEPDATLVALSPD